MSAAASPVYEFGDFHLDVEERQLLRRDGTAVPLTPRVFSTLRYLVEHSGRVLDKEVLMEAVWPDAIVEENNLAQNISTLRRAFGESPGSQRYIVTVPGRGYRFIAEVTQWENGKVPEGPAETAPPPAAAPVPVTPPATRSTRRPSLLVALILCALGAVIFVIWWSRAQAPVVAPANIAPTARAIPDKSIAVLPFDNLSDDSRNAFFATAVQDEILSNLARLADLKVISRTSASLYKTGNPRNMREIGEQLGVAHLVEGSVQHSGNRVRVNAQLIDSRTDAHLWAQTYDRELADVLAIQSEIARAIADQLKAKISPGEEARLALKPTENSEAYLLYLRAREIETRFRAAERGIRQWPSNYMSKPATSIPALLWPAPAFHLISHRLPEHRAGPGGSSPRRGGGSVTASAWPRVKPSSLWRIPIFAEKARLRTRFAGTPASRRRCCQTPRKCPSRLPTFTNGKTNSPRGLPPCTGPKTSIRGIPPVLSLLVMTLRWIRDWPEATRTHDRLRASSQTIPVSDSNRGALITNFARTGDIKVLKKSE